MAKLATGRHEIVGAVAAPGTASPAARRRRPTPRAARLRPAAARLARAAGARHLPLALHRRATASTTGSSELDFGFELVDRQSTRRAGRLHRRADPELRRRARAARRLHGGAGREVPRARHAADLRRGADRPRPHRRPVRLRARRRRAGFLTLSKTLGAGLPLAAVLTTPEIEDVAATSAASCSTPRTPPIRCRRPSASR